MVGRPGKRLGAARPAATATATRAISRCVGWRLIAGWFLPGRDRPAGSGTARPACGNRPNPGPGPRTRARPAAGPWVVSAADCLSSLPSCRTSRCNHSPGSSGRPGVFAPTHPAGTSPLEETGLSPGSQPRGAGAALPGSCFSALAGVSPGCRPIPARPRQNIPNPPLTVWNARPPQSSLNLVNPSVWEKTPPMMATIHMTLIASNKMPAIFQTVFIIYLRISSNAGPYAPMALKTKKRTRTAVTP